MGGRKLRELHIVSFVTLHLIIVLCIEKGQAVKLQIIKSAGGVVCDDSVSGS